MAAQVPGLSYFPRFVGPEEEAVLLDAVEADPAPWAQEHMKRRTKQFGRAYNYKKRGALTPAEPFPAWCSNLLEPFSELPELKEFRPDQLIVNAYRSGEGIAAHIDHAILFGDTVATLSLGSQCHMDFTLGAAVVPVLLGRGSLAVLQGEARYIWKHAIPQRKNDYIDGVRVPRGTRVSLTFRESKK
jgi:alkylated DNA repair dioxygenase AlkB